VEVQHEEEVWPAEGVWLVKPLAETVPFLRLLSRISSMATRKGKITKQYLRTRTRRHQEERVFSFLRSLMRISLVPTRTRKI
jgi:hypothetical protein